MTRTTTAFTVGDTIEHKKYEREVVFEILTKKAAKQETARCFTFDDSNPIQYLWIVHRFVMNEPVIVESSLEREGVITLAFFENGKFGVRVRLNACENTPHSCIVWENDKGQLPIRPTNLRPNEAVVHPKFGSGKILGVDEEGGVVVKFAHGIRWMRGKKLRRIHLEHRPFSADAAA